MSTSTEKHAKHTWGPVKSIRIRCMKQNIYDDQEFFLHYSKMLRSTGGLDCAEEWPAFRALLPDLADKNVPDLGCGFGWHCRYARQQNARSVLGVNLSEQMLAQAKALTNDSGIQYRRSAIEALSFKIACSML